MTNRMKNSGFTLVELMIVVATLAVIAAIGIPMYNGYIETARDGVLLNNIASLEIFEEDLKLRTGNYGGGTYDLGGGDTSLTTNVGWTPQGDAAIVYVVTATAGTSYQVTATDGSGNSVCRVYPARTVC